MVYGAGKVIMIIVLIMLSAIMIALAGMFNSALTYDREDEDGEARRNFK